METESVIDVANELSIDEGGAKGAAAAAADLDSDVRLSNDQMSAIEVSTMLQTYLRSDENIEIRRHCHCRLELRHNALFCGLRLSNQILNLRVSGTVAVLWPVDLCSLKVVPCANLHRATDLDDTYDLASSNLVSTAVKAQH